eukprot:TRINITY_DN43577_c0_g1_i2.p2 TRINITY_DN43577_c0_g1~~TRINITY_DN43577_c0_g1_i2.p2  ORF type:complete len:261 (+),score=71.97 TRINITY_DN43577_c0_g1_i2:120-902(+)
MLRSLVGSEMCIRDSACSMCDRCSEKQEPRDSPSSCQDAVVPANAGELSNPDVYHLGVPNALRVIKQEQPVAAAMAPLRAEFECVCEEVMRSDYETIVSQPNQLQVQVREDEGTGLLILKTTDIVPGARASELFRILSDVKLRLRWETKFLGWAKQVEDLAETPGYVKGENEVLLYRYPGNVMMKGRELLDRRTTWKDEERQLYLWVHAEAQGIEHDKTTRKGTVRGRTIYQLNMCYGVPGGAAVYPCILTDPKLSLIHI